MLKSWVNSHPWCTQWRFHQVKVVGEFLPMVYTVKVSPCQSHGWILTHGVHCESFTMSKSSVNSHPWCTLWKFHQVKVMGEFSPMAYTVKVSPCQSHGWILTHGVHCESFTKSESWVTYLSPNVCMWHKSSSFKRVGKFSPMSDGKKVKEPCTAKVKREMVSHDGFYSHSQQFKVDLKKKNNHRKLMKCLETWATSTNSPTHIVNILSCNALI